MLSIRSLKRCWIVWLFSLFLVPVGWAQGGINRWTVRHPSQSTGAVAGLAVDPQDPKTVYLATVNGFFRSQDSGQSWEMVNPGGLGRQMLPDGSTAPTTLFALGGNGIITSSDGGESWNDATVTRTWNQGPGETLLAVDSSLPGIGVYVSTVCCPPLDPPEVEPLFETWRSADGGAQFAEVSGQVGFARSIAFDNHAPRTIYLASDEQVLRSQDDGETWQPTPGNGLPQGLEVSALAIDPSRNPGLLIAGAQSGLIFVSADRGENWSASGEVDGSVRQISVDSAGNRSLYYARANSLFARFGRDTPWLRLRSGQAAENITFLSLASTAAGPAALFAVVNERLEQFQPEYRYLPQIGSGQVGSIGLETFFLSDNAGQDSFMHLEFFASSGEPLALALADMGEQSSLGLALQQGEARELETVAGQGLRVGYARLLAGQSIGGTAIFTGTDIPSGLVLYEAGVPLAGALSDFSVPVDSRGFRDTGLALVNTAAEEAHLVLRLYDETFQLIASEELTLLPSAHLARFVFELFQESAEALGELRGTLTVQSDRPLAAIVLRQNGDPLRPFPDTVPTLTVFPVIPGRADQVP